MSPATRCAKKHVKARRRRYLKAHERLARDRRQAQHAAEALQQALDDLGLPKDLVTEIEGRLHSQLTFRTPSAADPCICHGHLFSTVVPSRVMFASYERR
jgi:hypothetical protein